MNYRSKIANFPIAEWSAIQPSCLPAGPVSHTSAERSNGHCQHHCRYCSNCPSVVLILGSFPPSVSLSSSRSLSLLCTVYTSLSLSLPRFIPWYRHRPLSHCLVSHRRIHISGGKVKRSILIHPTSPRPVGAENTNPRYLYFQIHF